MAEDAWHRRPIIIGALLFLFPPIGIALMWLRFGWTPRTKLIVSGVAAIWFGFVVWQSQAGHAKSTKSQPEAQAVKNVPSLPTSAATGPELIAKTPLLLVPLNLKGFALTSAVRNEVCCGIHAVYSSADASTRGLTVEVWIDSSNEANPSLERSKSSTSIKVEGHDGIVDDTPKLHDVTIEWLSGAWHGMVIAHYAESTKAAAQISASKAASDTSKLLDRYLTGTPPTPAEREQQLASVSSTNAGADAQARNARPARLMTKLRETGIGETTIARVDPDQLGSGDDLIVVVGSAWPGAPRQERLQVAQTVWRMWGLIARRSDMDAVHIKLVDTNGNKVGGSGVMGSSIEVDE